MGILERFRAGRKVREGGGTFIRMYITQLGARARWVTLTSGSSVAAHRCAMVRGP